jgi:hypothetical protein
MPREKVTFVRSREFETVDDELTAALDQLDQVNQRIVDLLSTEAPPPPETETVESPAGADNDGPAQESEMGAPPAE